MEGFMRRRGKAADSWELRAFAGRDAKTGKKRYTYETFRGTKRAARIARRVLDQLANSADTSALF